MDLPMYVEHKGKYNYANSDNMIASCVYLSKPGHPIQKLYLDLYKRDHHIDVSKDSLIHKLDLSKLDVPLYKRNCFWYDTSLTYAETGPVRYTLVLALAHHFLKNLGGRDFVVLQR